MTAYPSVSQPYPCDVKTCPVLVVAPTDPEPEHCRTCRLKEFAIMKSLMIVLCFSLLWPGLAAAQMPSCEERLAVMQKWLQTVGSQREQLEISDAKRQVENERLTKTLTQATAQKETYGPAK